MKKIVVIEDDQIIRENLESLLEVEGFDVSSSETGIHGSELIKQKMPDLVLCDIMLPDTDGYNILKELKEDSSTKFIPFIFLTAKAEMRDLRNGMNLGADDYLTKPYDARELLDVINTRIANNKRITEESSNINDNEKKLESDSHIFIQTAKFLKPILVGKIVCIIGNAEYSELFTEDGNKATVRRLIKTWEQILPEQSFLRIHKSMIINLTYIDKVEKWFNNSYRITLKNYTEPLISSRRYSSKLRENYVL